MDRPSRSQQNLLEFIEQFVAQHGYGPSYREIMRAMDYKSVSTVAIHINGLVAKGNLRKHGRSARSLEVVKSGEKAEEKLDHEAWLSEKIKTYATSKNADQTSLQAMAQTFRKLELKTAQAKTESYLKET